MAVLEQLHRLLVHRDGKRSSYSVGHPVNDLHVHEKRDTLNKRWSFNVIVRCHQLILAPNYHNITEDPDVPDVLKVAGGSTCEIRLS